MPSTVVGAARCGSRGAGSRSSATPGGRLPQQRHAGSLSDNAVVAHRLPTAPIAAFGLIAGYTVAIATGSRPLGGVVLAICAISCIRLWLRRDGSRTTLLLAAAGLLAFALSHVIALIIGAWPAVLVAAALTAALCWRQSDVRHLHPARG